MAIKWVEHNQINLNKWDRAIADSINSNIFGFYWYLNLTTQLKWDAIITDDYELIMPLPYKKIINQKILYLPQFIPYLGPFSKKFINKNYLEAILNKIMENFAYAEFILPKFTEIPKNLDLEIQPLTFFAIDTIYNYNTLLNLFSYYAHQLIAKAKRENYEFITNVNVDGIIQFMIENNYFDNLNKIDIVRNILKIAKEKKRLFITAIYSPNSRLLGLNLYFTVRYSAALFAMIIKSDLDTETEDLVKYSLFNQFLQINAGKPITLSVYPWLQKVINFDFLTHLNFKKLKLYKIKYSKLPSFIEKWLI